jgi:hypothetical protein
MWMGLTAGNELLASFMEACRRRVEDCGSADLSPLDSVRRLMIRLLVTSNVHLSAHSTNVDSIATLLAERIWNPQSPDDQTSLVSLDDCDVGEMSHLLEAQAFVDSSGGCVVIEVHTEQCGHAESRAFVDHKLFESSADSTVVIRGGYISAHFGRCIVSRATSIEGRQVRHRNHLSIEFRHPDWPLGWSEFPKPVDSVGDGDRLGICRGPTPRNRLIVDFHNHRKIRFRRIAYDEFHRPGSAAVLDSS